MAIRRLYAGVIPGSRAKADLEEPIFGASTSAYTPGAEWDFDESWRCWSASPSAAPRRWELGGLRLANADIFCLYAGLYALLAVDVSCNMGTLLKQCENGSGHTTSRVVVTCCAWVVTVQAFPKTSSGTPQHSSGLNLMWR